MRKILATIIMATLLTIVFAGCGAKDKAPKTPDVIKNNVSSAEKVEEEPNFFECSSVDDYRKEILQRLALQEEAKAKAAEAEENEEEIEVDIPDFITEEEENYLRGLEDFELKILNREDGNLIYMSGVDRIDAYYPILCKTDDGVQLFYTSPKGEVTVIEIEGFTRDYLSSIHNEYMEDKEEIERNQEFNLVYNQETGEIQKWSFGEVKTTYTVPKGAVYVGFSDEEGHLFRSGTDIYSLQGEKVVTIAHNVSKVLVSDYYHTSDFWSQPMFQMTDGSIKVYVGWVDTQDHLVDPIYEGGYR